MTAHSERMLTLLAYLNKDPRREYTAVEAIEATGIPRGTIGSLIARLVATGLATQSEGVLGTRPFKLTSDGIISARSAAAPPAAPQADPAKAKFYGSLAELAAAVERGEETEEFYELARRRIYGTS